MGLSGILMSGQTGLIANRNAIEITSENIANINTDGYSKQRAIFENAPLNNANGFFLGTGVVITEVQRSYDAMLQKQLVDGNSSYGESAAKETVLEQIEPSFNELSNDGLGTAIENFFNSWQDLSGNAQGAPERQAVLSQAQVLVDTFHQMSSTLNDAVSYADDSLTGYATDITGMAKNIASLNDQILQTESLGGNANELRDRREYLVQEMATQVGVTYAEQTNGTLTVTLAGGQNLVQGLSYGTLSTQTNAGTGLNDIMLAPIGGGAPVNVTSTIGGPNNSLGKVGGTLQIRDTVVPGYEAKLNEMAKQLVTSVNTQHSAGFGLDGTQNNFFTPANTTAATISILAGLTTNKIAAAGQNPVTTSGPGDNKNALALAAISSSNVTFTVGANVTTSTFSSYFSAFVSSVGLDTENAKNVTTQNEAFLKQLNAIRESNAGVSLDEEMTNLMKYQRAYQASAKVISTASDMMDTLLGMVD
jgi:flagellar hook-associated protein 1 FlgK